MAARIVVTSYRYKRPPGKSPPTARPAEKQAQK
jgi:hypothetical protein